MKKPVAIYWPFFALCAGLLFLVSLLCLGFTKVRGVSMEPTYQNGQVLLINRWSFGIPNLIIGGYWLLWKAPKIGDIVISMSPDNVIVVKRIIGVPGSSIKIQNHYLFLSDKKIKLEPVQEYWLSAYPKVPEGYFFLMGDNLMNSRDSRDWGFVEMDKLQGKVMN